MDITVDFLQTTLRAELEIFYKKEHYLLDVNLCERGLVFRLGAQMLKKFKPADIYAEFDVGWDCRENVIKKEKNSPRSSTDLSIPDLLILHMIKPGNLANKCAIEVKKASSKASIAKDIKKMVDFTGDPESAYLLGAHIFLDKRNFIVVWYEKGKATSCEQYCFDSDCRKKTPYRLPCEDNFSYASIKDLRQLLKSASAQSNSR